MSQTNVERVLGRLVTDEAFRARFAADPCATLCELATSGLELTWCELRALATVDVRAASRFSAAIDERLQKSDLHGGVQ